MRDSNILQQALVRSRRYMPWYEGWVRRSIGRELDEMAQEPRLELEHLPLMTHTVLEEQYYTDDNPLAARSDVHYYRTSGTSSGRRKAIYYSEADEEDYIRFKLQVYRQILGSGQYRSAIADMGTGHAEATSIEVFRRLGMNAESIPFQAPIEQHLERLALCKPEVLYTMPSILDRILNASIDATAYGIRHVILVGEMASPAWIQLTAKRLGIGADHITDTYGSIEIGTIAYYSHEHGRYLLTDGLLAEGVRPEQLDADLEPLVNAEESVLVLTSGHREAFPAIRYVTYDVVRDLRPIMVDGRLRQSFSSIVKRIGPDLKHGEKISIYDIENVVLRHLHAGSVQVKVAHNALIVYIFHSTAEQAILQRIKHDIEQQIPEIGTMIQSGILGEIQVIRGDGEPGAGKTSVKHKKIWYE
ncbi:CoF synthetase [Paenibacillus sp. EZ-K15]|uniref:CoF synthetase n=1 Tax=Paenibacillus sp. EZ-K15 TaxID=2044275 RepID=UPI001F47E0C6|nr:CoF synthetase [Paenibacillus sp. EZ-K15]